VSQEFTGIKMATFQHFPEVTTIRWDKNGYYYYYYYLISCTVPKGVKSKKV